MAYNLLNFFINFLKETLTLNYIEFIVLFFYRWDML